MGWGGLIEPPTTSNDRDLARSLLDDLIARLEGK